MDRLPWLQQSNSKIGRGVVYVKDPMKNKNIKRIKVNADKCTGCRSCEMACSAFHAVPRYSSVNPARARIRVFMDEVRDLYVPIRGGNYTQAECNGRNYYELGGKEYPECAFCPASCPSRNWFTEPDSGLPLKCDMCEDTTSLPEPMCVQACKFDALTYEEIEGEIGDQKPKKELEIGLEYLVEKYGFRKMMDSIARMAKKK
jgi:benzoyl-CoA reductase subunit BamC